MKQFIKAAGTAGALLLSAPQPVLAQGATTPIIVNPPDAGTGISSFTALVSAVISVGFIVAIILTFIMLIWGGIQWITSGGDKAANEAARGRITSALIGIGIIAAVWVLMTLVSTFFGLRVFELTIPTAASG